MRRKMRREGGGRRIASRIDPSAKAGGCAPGWLCSAMIRRRGRDPIPTLGQKGGEHFGDGGNVRFSPGYELRMEPARDMIIRHAKPQFFGSYPKG